MNTTKKRRAAVLAAVSMYVCTEEEALVMPPPETPVSRNFNQGNLWGISGRQSLMQMRNLMQMRAFDR